MQRYIIIVDDDPDDLEICEMAREKIAARVDFIYIHRNAELIPFLRNAKSPPLLIISDMNMPGMDAFTLRKILLEDPELRYKSTPFLYWSTSASKANVQRAFDNSVHGFFEKPVKLSELCELLEGLIFYWTKSLHPKQF